MKKIFAATVALLLAAFSFTAISAWVQSPEEMYSEYITPETREILEKADRLEDEAMAAEAAAKTKKTLALSISIIIGLIPLCHIGRDIIKRKSWKENPGGTVRALGVGLIGGVVLFGLNYGVFLLKIRMGDGFNTAFAFLIVALLIAGAIYLLKKTGTPQE